MLKGWRRVWQAASSGKILLLVAGVFAVYLYAYFWHLSSLLPGANSDESSTLAVSGNLHNIWHSLINAPFSLAQFLALKVHYSHLSAGRTLSAILMAGFAACLYYLIKCWFGRSAGVIGALFFLTNPYALILGRTASAQIMLFWTVVVAAAFSWVLRTDKHLVLAWALLCASIGIGLYVPGFIWLLLAAGVFMHTELEKAKLTLSKVYFYGGIAIGLLIFSPLLYSLMTGNAAPSDWLWFPADWPNLIQIAKFWGWSVLAIFIKSPDHTNYILGRSPMLGAAEIALLAFGVYALYKRLISAIYLILVIIAPVLLMAAVNQDTTPLYYLLPISSVLSAVGVRFLYLEWKRVFPNNPLSKALAVVLISLLLIVHIGYGLRYALVAWPHNPEIKQAYMIK